MRSQEAVCKICDGFRGSGVVRDHLLTLLGRGLYLFSVGAANVRVERIWGWDGGSFFLPHDKKVLVEIFGPELPVYNNYTELTALFSTTTSVEAQLHLEFQAAWECGTAAVLAAKVGTFAREASDYWDKFIALMAAHRTPIKVDLDFASRESK